MAGDLMVKPRKRWGRLMQRGMTTAEYAVGTVGVASLASLIAWCTCQDWFRVLVEAIVKALFASITGLL